MFSKIFWLMNKSTIISPNGAHLIQFSIYSQCSVDRIISLLDAVVDTYSKIGQEVFNLGNCTAIETNNVYAHTKGKDGKFTALNMTASEWLESEIKKTGVAAFTVENDEIKITNTFINNAAQRYSYTQRCTFAGDYVYSIALSNAPQIFAYHYE